MSPIFLHLDMDAFFAAVEQADHPEMRGKPVVVGADPKGGTGRGVVSTCSYEARKYGIRSAMPISKAFHLCPHAIYVFPRGHRYGEISRMIMNQLKDFSPDVEPISIDEAFLDITSTHKLWKTPENLARQLKKRIYETTQLTASIGIAPSKFVAKIASDLKKPDGLVIVEQGTVKEFLAPLDISRMWGIGPKTLPHFHAFGIRTIGDLAQYSQNELSKRFGQSGLHFWNLANGIDRREIQMSGSAKSISKEVTFDHDRDDPAELRNTLLYLCTELAYEMRRKQYRGRTVQLKIRLEDFSTFTRSRTLMHATQACDEIFNCIGELFSEFDWAGHKVRLIGVGISQLMVEENQLDLFDPADEQAAKLDRVMDKVREKFGDQAITRASLIRTKHDSQWIKD
jgi:DNA polymerase IV